MLPENIGLAVAVEIAHALDGPVGRDAAGRPGADHARAIHQPRVDDPRGIHLRLAESAAEVDGARDRILANSTEMMRLASAGTEIPLTQGARYRWDAAKAIDWSVRAVDRMLGSSWTTRSSGPGATCTRCERTWPTIRRRSRPCSDVRSSTSRPSTGYSNEGP